MSKYHVNPETGNHGRCSAEEGNCPFIHGDTVEEARKNYESSMEGKETTTFHGKKKIYSPEIKISPSTVVDDGLDVNMMLTFEPLNERHIKESEEFIASVGNGEIPESFPQIENVMSDFTMHQKLMSRGYFGRATKEFARSFKKEVGDNAVILDPMAGKGFMAKAFQEQGLKVIASDDFSWEAVQGDHIGVKNMDAMESVRKHAKYATHMVVSWPPMESTIDRDIMDAAREENPDITLVYIGEEGGCTGSDELWESYDVEKIIPGYKTSYSTVSDNAYIIRALSPKESEARKTQREEDYYSIYDDYDEDYDAYDDDDEDLDLLRSKLFSDKNRFEQEDTIDNNKANEAMDRLKEILKEDE